MYALEAKNIKFGYNNKLILNDISFNIEKGSFTSIIGPNGSGKSTLLKILNNIYTLNEGKLEINGENINNLKKKELAKKMALVPQNTQIDYNFTVEDIVLMGRYPYKSRFQKESEEDYKIVRNSLKMTNTIDLSHRYINDLSGGERQRVIISKALAQKAEIILLDEPTSSLDINHQIEILELLKELNEKEKTTIILVIHDINLAARYSKELIILKNGKIVSKGTPDKVINKKNIEDAYNINTIIEKNKYTNSLYLTPINIKKKVQKTNLKKIHIISGGGTASELINRFLKEEFLISLGVLNIGDSDWEHAKSLNLDLVEESPFTKISDAAHFKNIDAVLNSDIVIISDMPIGFGNLKNLLAAKKALENNIPVFYLKAHNLNNDYTKGEGIKIIRDMEKMGMKIKSNIEEIVEEIDLSK